MSENTFEEKNEITESGEVNEESTGGYEQPSAVEEKPYFDPKPEQQTMRDNVYNGYYRTDQASGYNSWQNTPYDTSANGQNKKVKKEKEPRKKGSGRIGLVAGTVAAALVVGLGAGYAGSVLANGVGAKPFSMPTDSLVSDSVGEQPTESSEERNSIPVLDENTATQAPLDENKVHNDENNILLNAEELYEKVKNSAVVVYHYSNVQGSDQPVADSLGSGVIFTSEGHVITNAHVVDGAAKVTVKAADPDDNDEMHEYEAEVLGIDDATDIAVLKVTRDRPFDYAKLGNSDNVRVGQEVCAIGNPNTLTNSLTKGIVSGLDRVSLLQSSYACSTIQIDAAVNNGNSGGGLFDMYGNVIGIVNTKYFYTASGTIAEGIGFAITINEAKPIIQDLMSLGYVSNRPGLGINGQMLGEYAAYMYGFPSDGLRVTYIDEDMPVAKSGLTVGDVIVKIDDAEVSSMTDIQNEIANHNIGDTVELTVLRANQVGNIKQLTITCELAEFKQ